MSEHPRVLVEAERLQAMAAEERRETRAGAGIELCGGPGEMGRVDWEFAEEQDRSAEMEALAG